jgi:hypothetical protein
MKNFLYILIFIPSLLFSQETKNMELVGVRNITCESNQAFEIDEGHIMKILNVSHYGFPGGTDAQYLKLNNEYIYYTKYNSGNTSNLINHFPFYLNSGTHELVTNSNTSATLYGLEFKLTTP